MDQRQVCNMADIQNVTNLVDPWRLALRYNNSPMIRKLYDGLGAIIDNSSLWNFGNFFDVNQATGVWLDKLGTLYNLNRPIGLTGQVFVLDIDRLDDQGIRMDGFTESLSDAMFRSLFRLLTASYLVLPSVDTLVEFFQDVFGGEEQVRCEIIDSFMYFEINLYFANPQYVKVLYTILDLNPRILGDFPGVDYKVIPQLMYP